MEVVTLIDNNKYDVKETYSEDPTSKLDQTIDNIIKNEGYMIYKVQKETISTNGGNYLGLLYEVDIKGSTKDSEHKETNIFIKSIVCGDKMTFVSINEVYRTELFAYRELSDIFAELQEDANVPLQERYKMVKSYNDSNMDAIILENVSRRGYKTYNRMNTVPLEFVEKCIIELAKFHGLSFVLQEKRREYFNRNIKLMKYPIIFEADWRKFVTSMYNITIKNVEDDIKEKVQNTYFNITEKCVAYMQDETLWMCLCHGDYRPNNIMTKTNNEKVLDIIPIDYQIMHYGCPVFDILYLIYTCTDRKFRKAHMSHVKDLYHNTLRKFMEYFNIDVEMVFPRKKFEQIYKEKLDYGLIVGYMYLPFMLASEDDVPDLTQDLTGLNFQLNDTYKDRLRDIVDDFVEWGYIV